jgi:hypothetical protein
MHVRAPGVALLAAVPVLYHVFDPRFPIGVIPDLVEPGSTSAVVHPCSLAWPLDRLLRRPDPRCFSAMVARPGRGPARAAQRQKPHVPDLFGFR